MKCKVIRTSSGYSDWFRKIMVNAIIETIDEESNIKDIEGEYDYAGEIVLLEPATLHERVPINSEFFFEGRIITQKQL